MDRMGSILQVKCGRGSPDLLIKKLGLTKVSVSETYKWPSKWVTGGITLLIEVINPFLTGDGDHLVLLVLTKVSKGFRGWASIPTQLFTGPSLKDADSTGTKDWCRHHSCIHYIFLKSHDILYIDILYIDICIYFYNIFIYSETTSNKTRNHTQNFSWHENLEGAEVSKLAWDFFSSPPLQLRAARESQRSGWQESPSSSSGIVFAVATNKSNITKLAS